MKNKKVIILLLSCLVTLKIYSQQQSSILQKVLENLQVIKSAQYYTQNETWQADDTIPLFSNKKFVKEYDNPTDKTIGAAFVVFDAPDTTRFTFGYDADVRVLIDHAKKTVTVDDFTHKPLPFRPVSAPFYNYTKSIINYILETKDNIDVETKETEQEYYIKLTINEDAQIEFFGKPYRMPNQPNNFDEKKSIYELWITKSDNLPYKVRREMAHDISLTICYNPVLEKKMTQSLNLKDYLPKDYEMQKYGNAKNVKQQKSLVGYVAPDWTLNDMNNNSIALADCKSKVLIINFTGIGCGACQASIPFLKKIKNEYDSTLCDIVAIETWTRNVHSYQNYVRKQKINYKFLSATDTILDSYQTGGFAPVFYILDEDRVIRKVIRGYKKEDTDKNIIDAINELL